jgi:hypothetical protein
MLKLVYFIEEFKVMLKLLNGKVYQFKKKSGENKVLSLQENLN